jgi:glycosyltransferase involved in cell wall biosynthesis
LSKEKGLHTLIRAWERMPPRLPLQIIGDGPERAELENQVRRRKISNVNFRGFLSRAETIAAMKRARFIVVPSVWYEGFPMVIVEALACGIPVICSRLGAMKEIVDDRRTGLHFNPGDAGDLARTADWAWSHPVEMSKMGLVGRCEYERRYTAERNYKLVMEIYGETLQRAHDFARAPMTEQPARP